LKLLENDIILNAVTVVLMRLSVDIVQGAAKKQPQKFFVIFSASVSNFNLKFYS